MIVRGIHRWPVNSPHKGPVTHTENVSIWWLHHAVSVAVVEGLTPSCCHDIRIQHVNVCRCNRESNSRSHAIILNNVIHTCIEFQNSREINHTSIWPACPYIYVKATKIDLYFVKTCCLKPSTNVNVNPIGVQKENNLLSSSSMSSSLVQLLSVIAVI